MDRTGGGAQTGLPHGIDRMVGWEKFQKSIFRLLLVNTTPLPLLDCPRLGFGVMVHLCSTLSPPFMNPAFESIFARLRGILEPHSARLKVTADAPGYYCP